MRVSDIRDYLGVYAVVAAIGSVFGFLLSLLFQDVLLESIRLNLGGSGNHVTALLFGGAGASIALFLLVLLHVNRSPEAVSDHFCGAGNPVWRTGRPTTQLKDGQAVWEQRLFLQFHAWAEGCPGKKGALSYDDSGNHPGKFHYDCTAESVPYHFRG